MRKSLAALILSVLLLVLAVLLLGHRCSAGDTLSTFVVLSIAITVGIRLADTVGQILA